MTLSVRSLTILEKNIVVTIRCFFKDAHAFFFLARFLIDRCQIVTDNCNNNASKFVWKPFHSHLSLRKLKCFGEATLFNLHCCYFSYHLQAQKFFILWKILL